MGMWTSLRAWALGLTAVFLVVGQAPAQGNTTVVEEILNILRQNGTITEEQKKMLLERAAQEQIRAAEERAKEKAQAEKDRMAALLAGVEKGKPYLKSADGDFRFELGGRVQTDYHVAEGDARSLTGTNLEDRFLIRRARLEVAGTLFRWIAFKVESDFTEGVSLKDAYLNFRFLPEVQLRAGQYKVPFSREELTSSRFIDFVERSVINELAPARDVGAVVHGSLGSGLATYTFGVFNGSGEDVADNSDGKDIAGRVTLAPFRPAKIFLLSGLELGGNFTWGDQDASTSAQGRTSARTSTRFRYFAPHAVRGDRTRFGGDLAWLVGPAALKFEYAEQHNERLKVGPGGIDLADLIARGWYVSGTFVVTGENKLSSGNVVPRRPFMPVAGHFGPGAWEVGVRYAVLDFESDSPVDLFDGNLTNGFPGGGTTAENGVQALTVGVNWYWNANVRYMLNWTRYEYDNDLGTPFSCQQPSCSAASLVPGDDSWELLTRVQVWF